MELNFELGLCFILRSVQTLLNCSEIPNATVERTAHGPEVHGIGRTVGTLDVRELSVESYRGAESKYNNTKKHMKHISK